MKKETYDFMSDARSTIKELIGRKRCCGEKIGGGQVLVTIAADYSTGELLSTADGNTSEIAAIMALYIKKLNLKEKVDMAYEDISKDIEILCLLDD